MLMLDSAATGLSNGFVEHIRIPTQPETDGQTEATMHAHGREFRCALFPPVMAVVMWPPTN